MALAEGKFITAAGMENPANVDIARGVVRTDAITRDVGRAVTTDAIVQQIACSAKALGIREIGDKAEAVTEAVFHAGL